MSPVTQTAEVEVNNASEKGVASPLRLENGNIKRKVPKRITPEKPRMIIWNEVNFLFNNTTPVTAILLYTPLCALNYKAKEVKKVKENAYLY